MEYTLKIRLINTVAKQQLSPGKSKHAHNIPLHFEEVDSMVKSLISATMSFDSRLFIHCQIILPNNQMFPKHVQIIYSVAEEYASSAFPTY